MKYVQAEKPPLHNGGAFYEHEIHFSVIGTPYSGRSAIRKNIEDFVAEHIGSKHTDFRVTLSHSWIRNPNTFTSISDFRTNIIVRFIDKNKALLFKLSWIE